MSLFNSDKAKKAEEFTNLYFNSRRKREIFKPKRVGFEPGDYLPSLKSNFFLSQSSKRLNPTMQKCYYWKRLIGAQKIPQTIPPHRNCPDHRKIHSDGKHRAFHVYDEGNHPRHGTKQSGYPVKKRKPKDIQLRKGKLY